MIKELKALKTSIRSQKKFTDEEIIEIIRAFRRGVSMADLATVTKLTRAGIYFAVGSWALNSAVLPEDNER